MKATPRIRKKRITAAELLRRIKVLVLEEPRRMNMRSWITAFEGRIRVRRNRFGLQGHELPVCGTVGCIAGWGATLLRKPGESPKTATARSRMAKLLGHRLSGGYWTDHDLFDPYLDDLLGTEPGTEAHAKAVAKRIDRYLAAHPDLETRVIDVAARKVVPS